MERDKNFVALLSCGQWDQPTPNGLKVNTVIKHEFCVFSGHVRVLGYVYVDLGRRCVVRVCNAFNGGNATKDQDANNLVIDGGAS